jgi:hypothetical protein
MEKPTNQYSFFSHPEQMDKVYGIFVDVVSDFYDGSIC